MDTAHSKEEQARDTISQLRLEISNLSKLVESGAGLNFGQDTSVQELTKMKDELIQQRDEQLKEIVNVCLRKLHLGILNMLFYQIAKKKTSPIYRTSAQSRTREIFHGRKNS